MASPTGPEASVVIDASAWISSLFPNDVNYEAAFNWIQGHITSGGGLVAPILFVVEVGAAVSRLTGDPSLAHDAISLVYRSANMILVPVDQDLINESSYLAAELGLRGADSLYVAVAKQAGLPLVSFDKDQLKRPAHLITTIRP